ncbi:Phosphoribosylformylglycinamidine synthase subunit PurL [Candidatus Calditenuaceae archaeon HR02]|nr:Phosphoribosylformylglycinamidine synthase subunit PurL [Candidatus Calditenuaceae archaeon HR02]
MRLVEEVAVTLTSEEREVVRKRLGREPNIIEWAVIEALWSEHCSYKSSRNILKMLPTEGVQVLVGPGFDAGLIDIGDGFVLSVHIESHNHPSAIDPYGGAATGIGGVVRDILSVGTRPVALLDSLRFGEIESSSHSRWLLRNVVKGIADYGNCIGVPTIAGELEFDQSFERNCLVDVMCIGAGRREEVVLPMATRPGCLVVLAGNTTGRDGILGASFASQSLDSDEEGKRSAVQIPDPFIEKLLIDALTEMFEQRLISAVKDLGGGGLATALSELAYKGGVGVDVDLSMVHRRETDMTPVEVLVSESQERMLLLVEGQKLERVSRMLEKYELQFSIIGRTVEERFVRLRWEGTLIAELPLSVLGDAPSVARASRRPEYLDTLRNTPPPREPEDLNKVFLNLLASPNISSKSWVYEQYDYEVGVRTVVKPGDADAAIIKLPNGKLAAVKLDGDSKKCYIDPYRGAMWIVSENFRNLASSGAKPCAIVDHQQFGDPGKPDVYWCFKECVRGVADYCMAVGVPVVGGKVSFYNEDLVSGRAIKPSPVIGGIGLLSDEDMVTTLSLKRSGDYIVVLGVTTGELGGSEYYEYIHRICGGEVPLVDPLSDWQLIEAVLNLRRMGVLRAAHDVSKGGLAVSLAEMAVRGRIGLTAELSKLPVRGRVLRRDGLLFSEGGSRIVVEVDRERFREAEMALRRHSVPFAVIGETGGNEISIKMNGEQVINLTVGEVEERWHYSLERLMEGYS